jgi:hypothetical protein
LPALLAYIAGMSRAQKQYTIRNVPAHVDEALRRRARSAGKSINQVALDALTLGAGVSQQFSDLDFMIGSMSAADAKRMDGEIAAQRRIDPKLWK